MQSIKVNLAGAKEVKAVVRAAFPDYRKLNAWLSEFPANGLQVNSYWSGGTKEEFAIVELSTLTRKHIPTSTHPYFDVAARGLANGQDADIVIDHVGNITLKHLPEGYALVRAGYSCGKPATAHVYLNAANMTLMLSAESRGAL